MIGVGAKQPHPSSIGSQRDFTESERQAGAMLGAREGGATAASQLDRPTHRASLPQQEVKVGRGVHGVEDICIVWDQQL